MKLTEVAVVAAQEDDPDQFEFKLLIISLPLALFGVGSRHISSVGQYVTDPNRPGQTIQIRKQNQTRTNNKIENKRTNAANKWFEFVKKRRGRRRRKSKVKEKWRAQRGEEKKIVCNNKINGCMRCEDAHLIFVPIALRFFMFFFCCIFHPFISCSCSRFFSLVSFLNFNFSIRLGRPFRCLLVVLSLSHWRGSFRSDWFGVACEICKLCVCVFDIVAVASARARYIIYLLIMEMIVFCLDFCFFFYFCFSHTSNQ